MWVLERSFLSFYAPHVTLGLFRGSEPNGYVWMQISSGPLSPSSLSFTLTVCSFTVFFNEAIYTEVMEQINDLIVPFVLY